jgi:hypothetical protein
MTIVQAIQNVLEAYNRPLTVMEIYQYIIENKLYVFKAKDPLHIVKTTIRRHCYNLHFSSAKNIKHFQMILDNQSFSTYGLYQPISNNSSDKELYLNTNTVDIKYFIEIIKNIKNNRIDNKNKLEENYDILIKFNIIDKINENYILTKYSNWFIRIEKYFKNKYLISPLDINEKLDILESYFLLQRVLKNDFTIIYNLLSLLKKKDYINLEDFSLELLIRIPWLIDFKILAQNENRITLTIEGESIADNLIIENINISKENVTINNFLLNQFVFTFIKINQLNMKRTSKSKLYLKKYFETCFNLHKDRFYDRVTISSFINSIILLSLIESNRIIEFIDIKTVLINTNYLKDIGYNFSYSIKEQDGYITKG